MNPKEFLDVWWAKHGDEIFQFMVGKVNAANERAEAAEAEAAALRERERWIPVEEKLPDEGQQVLVVEDGKVGINYIPYANSVPAIWKGRWMTGHDYVTHWKALSAAPSEQK